MSYYPVKICYRNILENSTVTSTNEDAAFPLYRTYDRDIGKLFKFTTAVANLYVAASQVGTIYPVNRCIIPAGHNLSGVSCAIQYYNVGWINSITWTQADNLVINKSFSDETRQQWRLLITSVPSVPPQLAELYLTNDYQFERSVRRAVVEKGRRNITREESVSGRVRIVKNGLERRARSYSVLANATQKASFETWNAVYDGTKFFYIIDHNATLMFMEMLNDFQFEYASNDYFNVNLELLEVL